MTPEQRRAWVDDEHACPLCDDGFADFDDMEFISDGEGLVLHYTCTDCQGKWDVACTIHGIEVTS